MTTTAKNITINDTTSNELEPEPETSTALVPVDPMASLLTMSEADFDAQVKKMEIWTSYTGPVPSALEDKYNLEIVVKGMIRQTLEHTDETTGEYKRWDEIRMKLDDDTIISAGGYGARQFADLMLPSLGQGDWPVGVRVMVKVRTLKTGNKMPTFQVLGKAAIQ